MSSDTAAGFAGVPMREQEIRFPVTPAAAVAANRSQRERLLAAVAALSTEEWAAPSRCAGWSVQDVVRHLVDINGIQLAALAAGVAGERFTGFQTFDPKSTPAKWIAAAGPQPVAATLAAFASTTEAVLADIDALPADPDSLLLSTPAGRQPWHRSVLHALFDSAIHERDILVPLGKRALAAAAEVGPIASYQLLLTGRVLAVVGIPVDLGLSLSDGPDLHLVVDGPLVALSAERVDGALTGAASAVLDAMGGRGELAEVLTGRGDLTLALGALRSLL